MQRARPAAVRPTCCPASTPTPPHPPGPALRPQAFDGAVRGLGVGEAVELEIRGGDWRPELLFTVPRDHPEITRLEGRYKK